MGLEISLLAVPALVALVIKGVTFLYTRLSRVRNFATRLFLFILGALTLQNAAELGIFWAKANHLPSPPLPISKLYLLSSVIALALLLHLALILALPPKKWGQAKHLVLVVTYFFASAISVAIVGSSLIVVGFEPANYTYTRIPGPYYFTFELYTVISLTAAILLLVYGGLTQDSYPKRLKNQIVLLGTPPMFVIVVTVVSLQHFFGLKLFNVTATLPLATTLFLLAIAYALHQQRLIDVRFYIPFSRFRKRKVALYQKLRTLIAEVEDFDSAEATIRKLAETLKCSVALIGPGRHLVVGHEFGGGPMPVHDVFGRVDRTVVADEIADSFPEMYRAMKDAHISMIVPFHPHSEHASAWLYLGQSFSGQVGTELDFRILEELFDKMADAFLDKMVLIRAELQDAAARVTELQGARRQLQQEIGTLREQIHLLRGTANTTTSASPESVIPVGVCFIGRNKNLFEALRAKLPQLQRYSSLASAAFRRNEPPEVVVVHVESDKDPACERFLRFLGDHREQAALLVGAGARAFARNNKRELLGRLIDVVPGDPVSEAIVRRVENIARVHRSTYIIDGWERPLIGESDAFVRSVSEARRAAGLLDPILVLGADPDLALALAAFMHREGGRSGPRVVLTGSLLEEGGAADIVAGANGGTLILPDLNQLRAGVVEQVANALLSYPEVRMVAYCPCSERQGAAKLLAPLRPRTLELPSLDDHAPDLLLLARYFALQFDLQAGTSSGSSEAQLKALIESRRPDTLRALRCLVFDFLCGQPTAPASATDLGSRATDRTLDEHLADYEARILKAALARSGGNKARAARMLGLRPNTLHYKLGKHGLLDKD